MHLLSHWLISISARPRPTALVTSILPRFSLTRAMSDDFTSRPAAKRVRSDKDHSKADTKHAEDSRQGGDDGKGQESEGKENGGHEDDDWQAVPPFSVGKSRDGWVTKWRESCWCGKSGLRWEQRGGAADGRRRSGVRVRQ